jgi:hypothetical protein
MIRELSCQGDQHYQQSLRIAEAFAFEQDVSSLLESGLRKKQKSPEGFADDVEASPSLGSPRSAGAVEGNPVIPTIF